MTRAALNHAARMRTANIGTFRRRNAALRAWHNRRAREIRRIEAWCSARLKLKGEI